MPQTAAGSQTIGIYSVSNIGKGLGKSARFVCFHASGDVTTVRAINGRIILRPGRCPVFINRSGIVQTGQRYVTMLFSFRLECNALTPEGLASAQAHGTR